MNAAFEDCVVLDECLSRFADRERAFAEYYRQRKPNTDALADLALQNFVEMRDKTASPVFRARRKIDHLLETAMPRIYLPLYTMVTFTRLPYAEAAKRAHRQDHVVLGALIVIVLTIVFRILRFAIR
jgi:kynurenine 3-monooxygenase